MESLITITSALISIGIFFLLAKAMELKREMLRDIDSNSIQQDILPEAAPNNPHEDKSEKRRSKKR